MIDPEKSFRRAIYQALLTQPIRLSIDGSNSDVPFFDGPVDDSMSNAYIILANQATSDASNKNAFVSNVSIVLDITCRGDYEMNHDFLDDISEQIEAILFPGGPGSNGLVAQAGVKFGRLERTSASYLDLVISSTQSIVRKLLTFSTTVYQ
jgi:hypothetical protein